MTDVHDLLARAVGADDTWTPPANRIVTLGRRRRLRSRTLVGAGVTGVGVMALGATALADAGVPGPSGTAPSTGGPWAAGAYQGVAPHVTQAELDVCSGFSFQLEGQPVINTPAARSDDPAGSAIVLTDRSSEFYLACLDPDSDRYWVDFGRRLERPMTFPVTPANEPLLSTFNDDEPVEEPPSENGPRDGELSADPRTPPVDDPTAVAITGPVSTDTAAVRVTGPDGTEHDADLGEGFFAFVTAAPAEPGGAWTVTYLDANGAVLDEVTID